MTALLKRSEDILADEENAAAVEAWVVRHGLTRLVLAGCTTTACIRRSSQSLHRRFAAMGARRGAGRDPPGQVVVDLSLCGARRSKHESSALDDPSCVGLYGEGALLQQEGEEGGAATPLNLAIAEMRDAGVHVVAEWQWCIL